MINEFKLNKSQYHELRFVEEDVSPGVSEDEITMHLTTGLDLEIYDRQYSHVGISLVDAKRLIKWLNKTIEKIEKSSI